MNEQFKNLFTTSACRNVKGFSDSLNNISTFEKVLNDDGTFSYKPIYKNSYSLFLDNEKYAQIGIGISHIYRGAFVVDSDTNMTPDELFNIYSRTFVEPTVILQNPKNGHTQIFFFFNKDVRVGTSRNGQIIKNNTSKKYLSYLRKLNTFLGIGDENFKGYWVKNPFNKNFECLYHTHNTYPFEVLCQLIDEIDTDKFTKEYFLNENYSENEFEDETDIDTLVDNCLSDEVKPTTLFNEEKVIVVHHHDKKEVKKEPIVFRFSNWGYTTHEDGTLLEDDEDEIVKEVVKSLTTKVKIDKRGKFGSKENSEYRHSYLFKLALRKVLADNEVNFKNLYDFISFYNTILFREPLSSKEIIEEVLNKTTLNKTLKTLLYFKKYREEIKDNIQTELAELMAEFDMNVSEVREELKRRGWSNYMIEKHTNGNVKEGRKLDYKNKYEGRYEGRYDRSKYESVERNKKVSKVRNWINKNREKAEVGKYPKKWDKEDKIIAKSLLEKK